MNRHRPTSQSEPTTVPPTSRRGVVAAIAAVGLVPFGVAAFAQLPTSAPDAVDVIPASATMTQKWVAINTAARTITLNSPDSATPLAGPQAITAKNCLLTQGALADQVVRFSATGGSPGFATGSYGVQEKKSGTGASCSQVNAATSESLMLSLGDLTKSTLGGQVLASSAYLDVDLKQGAKIRATLYLAGAPLSTTFELQSGSSISGSESDTVRQCNPGADSGSDAKVGDNCRWPISMPSWVGPDDGISFDSLKLEALAGSFSLQGGSDGVVPNFPVDELPPTVVGGSSILELVDGYEDVLDCNQDATEEADGDSPWVKIYRLDNADGSPCSEIAYTLSNGPFFARFLKPLENQPYAQFVWEVKWRDTYSSTSESTALRDLTINYENPATPADEREVPLGWCPDSTYKTTAPFYDGYDTDAIADFTDQEPLSTTRKEFACVISRSATVVQDPDTGDDYLSVRDLVYVVGDAKMQF